MSVDSGRFLFNFHGENLFLDRDNSIVARRSCADGILGNCAYAFVNRTFDIGESFTIRIHALHECSKSVFGFGMTSCNPETLNIHQLPEDCDQLYDRPEYWVIDKARFVNLRPGDELHFRYITSANGDGEIKCAKNNRKPNSLMFVDKTVPLWPFFELGNIAEIKILDNSSYYPDTNLSLTGSTGLITKNISQRSNTNSAQNNPNKLEPPTPSVTSPKSRSTTGGRKGPAPPVPPRPSPKSISHHRLASTVSPTILVAVTNYELIKPPISQKTNSNLVATKNLTPPPPASTVVQKTPSSGDATKSSTSSDECSVCMEKNVDCVLYTCGHMCMCFECAMSLKNSAKLCPVCRRDITDVIKIFKS